MNRATPLVQYKLRADIADMIQRAHEHGRHMAEWMPDEALNDAQRDLEAKHGTPRKFALACNSAIGEISLTEAFAASREYYRQWQEAGYTPTT